MHVFVYFVGILSNVLCCYLIIPVDYTILRACFCLKLTLVVLHAVKKETLPH